MTTSTQTQGTFRGYARSLAETSPASGAGRTPKARMARSPLRYPGGKSRAVKQIVELFPPGIESLASPFMGGGSVEIACASRGIRVHGYDAFGPLVDFWQETIEDPAKVAKLVYSYHPLTKTKFYALQKRYFSLPDRLERAAAFFVLNRSSYSGTTLSGGMSPGHPRFTPSAIERLANLRLANLSVNRADFRDSLPKHDDDFLYLDPPYANGENLYVNRGDMHKDFIHEDLAAILRRRDGWVLSYNDCDMVRDLYDGHQFATPAWTYGMSNDKTSNEVLILSKDLAGAL